MYVSFFKIINFLVLLIFYQSIKIREHRCSRPMTNDFLQKELEPNSAPESFGPKPTKIRLFSVTLDCLCEKMCPIPLYFLRPTPPGWTRERKQKVVYH